MLAYFAALEAALGPLMPFLRSELDLNYTTASLHFSGFALGMVVAGLTGDSLSRLRGRSLLFWGGATGMGLAAILLTAAGHESLTIAAAVIMGLLGTLFLIVLQAALSDHHGAGRAIAFTESNVGASLGAMLVPLLIGVFEGSGISWRWALISVAVFLVLLAWLFRGVSIPRERAGNIQDKAISGSLPRVFWAFWLVIVVGVAIEWCLVYWGADYLVGAAGLAKSLASTSMTLFFLAMVLGRIAGSRLARRYSSTSLLIAALVWTLVGFALFWQGPAPWATLLGLFFAGVGVANLYPLTLAIATTVAEDQADKASARITLGSGAAIFLAPLILGWSADRWGIEDAFALVGLLLLVAIGVIAAARRL